MMATFLTRGCNSNQEIIFVCSRRDGVISKREGRRVILE